MRTEWESYNNFANANRTLVPEFIFSFTIHVAVLYFFLTLPISSGSTMSYETITVSLVSTIAQNDSHKVVQSNSPNNKITAKEIKQRTSKITDLKSSVIENLKTKSRSKSQNNSQKSANTIKEIKSKNALENIRSHSKTEQIAEAAQNKIENNIVVAKNNTYLIAPPPVKKPELPLESKTSNKNIASSLADKVRVKSTERERGIELEGAVSVEGKYQPQMTARRESPQSLPKPEATEAIESSEKSEKANDPQPIKAELTAQKMEASKKEPPIRINEKLKVNDQETGTREDEKLKENIQVDPLEKEKIHVEPVSEDKTKITKSKAGRDSEESNFISARLEPEHLNGQDKSEKPSQQEDTTLNKKGLLQSRNANETEPIISENDDTSESVLDSAQAYTMTTTKHRPDVNPGELKSSRDIEEDPPNFNGDIGGPNELLVTEELTFPLKTKGIVSEYSPQPSSEPDNDKSTREHETRDDEGSMIFSAKSKELQESDSASQASPVPLIVPVHATSELLLGGLTLQENQVVPEDTIFTKEDELISSQQADETQVEEDTQKIDPNKKTEKNSLTESLTLPAAAHTEKPTTLAKDNLSLNTPKAELSKNEIESNDLDEPTNDSLKEETKKANNLKINDRHEKDDYNLEINTESERAEITDDLDSMVATANDVLEEKMTEVEASEEAVSEPPLISDKRGISLNDEKVNELIAMESVSSDKRDDASVANHIDSPESSREDSIIAEIQTSETNRTPSRESYQLLVDSNLTLAQTEMEKEKPLKENEAVLPIDILNDIEAEVYVKATGDKIVFSLERRPHPMESKHPRTKGEQVDLKVTEKYGEPGNERVMTYVERADKGVYILKIKNTSQAPLNLSVNLRLYSGRETEKQFGLQEIVLIASGEIDIKFLMPEAVFWDEKGYFTGEIENSGYITRFNAETGLVWKEKKRF